jgi:hypothetical protein
MQPDDPLPPSRPSGPSWTLSLALLGAAIVIAALIAYRLVYPFFHVGRH